MFQSYQIDANTLKNNKIYNRFNSIELVCSVRGKRTGQSNPFLFIWVESSYPFKRSYQYKTISSRCKSYVTQKASSSSSLLFYQEWVWSHHCFGIFKRVRSLWSFIFLFLLNHNPSPLLNIYIYIYLVPCLSFNF